MQSPEGRTCVFVGLCVDAPALGEVRGLAGRGLIVVGEDGRIKEAIRKDGPELSRRLKELQAAGLRVRELGDGEFLLPGFVDTHIHFPQFPYTGTGIDRPLMANDGFLAKHAFPTERGMADTARARQVYVRALEQLLRHGTTTAAIYASAHLEASKALVDAALEHGGPRCCVGKVSMDRHCPEGYVETAEASLRDTEEFIRYTQARACAGPTAAPYLVQPVVTPRFLPTCTRELLEGLGELAARHDCMVQSHMSESCDELAFSASLFDGQADAEVFEACGLLRAPCLMGHCVHLMLGEEERLKRKGAAIAHCPLSNFFFAKEALQVRQLVQRGVKVGLGTDVAGGYSPSMLSAIRSAVLASKALQFRRAPGSAASRPTDSEAPTEDELREAHDLSHFDALHLATQGGADAMGLGEALGTLDVGKAFDALVLTAEPTVLRFPGGTAEGPEDVLQKILTLGDDRNVREVYVDGVCVCPAATAAPSEPPLDLLSAYVYFWAVHQSMQCAKIIIHILLQPRLELWSSSGDVLMLPLVLLVLATRALPALLAAILLRIWLRFLRAPFIWESEYWATLLDADLLVALAFAAWRKGGWPSTREERSAVAVACGAAVREQLALLYAAAAFWKLNTSFLDPRTSCASIFLCQHMAAYLPAALTPPAVANLVVQCAPLLTLVVELAIPLLFVLGALRPRWQRWGPALGLLFHGLVVLTPPPNNAGGFSVTVTKYYFFLFPEATALAVREAGALREYVAAVAVLLMAATCRMVNHVDAIDWAPHAYTAYVLLFGRALSLDAAVPSGTRRASSTALPWPTRVFFLAVAFTYAFVLPVLGLMDQGTPNMFGNQRFHAGSNHLLGVPTGLLPAHAAAAGWPAAGAFSGGVLRVEEASSAYMRRRYPAEVTAVLAPRARSLLAGAGHTGRQFNPMLGRVAGLGVLPPPAPGAPFVPYTLPALELRRLLAEARALNESFRLVYTRLPAAGEAAGERWRREAKGPRVQYEEDGKGGRACTVEGAACGPDEPALQPEPGFWALKFLLWQPYPVLPGGWDEVHCFGP